MEDDLTEEKLSPKEYFLIIAGLVIYFWIFGLLQVLMSSLTK
jgi:hypothetical protein